MTTVLEKRYTYRYYLNERESYDKQLYDDLSANFKSNPNCGFALIGSYQNIAYGFYTLFGTEFCDSFAKEVIDDFSYCDEGILYIAPTTIDDFSITYEFSMSGNKYNGTIGTCTIINKEKLAVFLKQHYSSITIDADDCEFLYSNGTDLPFNYDLYSHTLELEDGYSIEAAVIYNKPAYVKIINANKNTSHLFIEKLTSPDPTGSMHLVLTSGKLLMKGDTKLVLKTTLNAQNNTPASVTGPSMVTVDHNLWSSFYGVLSIGTLTIDKKVGLGYTIETYSKNGSVELQVKIPSNGGNKTYLVAQTAITNEQADQVVESHVRKLIGSGMFLIGTELPPGVPDSELVVKNIKVSNYGKSQPYAHIVISINDEPVYALIYTGLNEKVTAKKTSAVPSAKNAISTSIVTDSGFHYFNHNDKHIVVIGEVDEMIVTKSAPIINGDLEQAFNIAAAKVQAVIDAVK